MRLVLEPKPKFGVTPFFKLNFFPGIPYEFETAVKNRRTAENGRWHFGPSPLLTSFVITYFQKCVVRGALTLRATHYQGRGEGWGVNNTLTPPYIQTHASFSPLALWHSLK